MKRPTKADERAFEDHLETNAELSEMLSALKAHHTPAFETSWGYLLGVFVGGIKYGAQQAPKKGRRQ